MSTLPCVILLHETGWTVESSSINMLPPSSALLIWNGWIQMVANVLYHQLADGFVHF